VLFTALRTIDTLKILLCPFLPQSSQRLHELLGYQGLIAPQPHIEQATAPDGLPREVLTGSYPHENLWRLSELPPGQALSAPTPLFTKLDESVVSEELARLSGASAAT
jgi:methionyl-tRNA synthetase